MPTKSQNTNKLNTHTHWTCKELDLVVVLVAAVVEYATVAAVPVAAAVDDTSSLWSVSRAEMVLIVLVLTTEP